MIDCPMICARPHQLVQKSFASFLERQVSIESVNNIVAVGIPDIAQSGQRLKLLEISARPLECWVVQNIYELVLSDGVTQFKKDVRIKEGHVGYEEIPISNLLTYDFDD